MDATRSFRCAREDDYDSLAEVMYDAVRNGETRYSEKQRQAWVPVRRGGQDWSDRLGRQEVVLVQTNEEILGFMSLERGGYIDFAYIRPKAQHTGLFRQLFERIVERARLNGERRLSTHASLMAEPAFAAVGFTVTTRETIPLGQEQLPRCEMEMCLSARSK